MLGTLLSRKTQGPNDPDWTCLSKLEKVEIRKVRGTKEAKVYPTENNIIIAVVARPERTVNGHTLC